jgi:3-isopropylmalate dehydrogenase
VIVGATGVWKYDKLERALRPEQGILGLRKELKLFANLRPAVLYDELVSSSPLKPEKVRGLDILIVRELNGDTLFRPAAGHAQGAGRRVRR